MIEGNQKNDNQPKGQPTGQQPEKGRINEGFNKGESNNNIGGGKSDSGEYGRGHTKPPRPKEESGK